MSVRTNPIHHTRATVEAIYERLVTEYLGKKAFRNAKGERIDVLDPAALQRVCAGANAV